MKQSFDHQAIESKWLELWEESRLFYSTTSSSDKVSPDKLYLLFAFAYPSGSGLHVGHVESKTALDILARFNRMQGKDVFFPVGWDAFGLPAENYAIKTGVHPAETTKQAIDTFRRQIRRIGISYNWDHELATSHPDYYRWTQWIFLKLFEKGMAYKAPGTVNWCDGCQTVLANEQVVQKLKHEARNSKFETKPNNQNSNNPNETDTVGVCERCDTEVVQKQLDQWYFKITDYKDELISGLDQVDWPKATVQQQLNWIGRSEGAEVRFKIQDLRFKNKEIELTTFTTRIDTIFGVTFLAMSPEKAQELIDSGWQANKEVVSYIDKAFKKTEEDRMKGEKNKTGVHAQLFVTNPVNEERVPVYVADYVLAGYGTGVVMGVPGHDTRDKQFADKFGLDVKIVVNSDKKGQVDLGEVYTDYGVLVDSGDFTDMSSQEAIEKIPQSFDSIDPAVIYKLRDWLISRQRYWGTPIPIVYDPDGKAHPVKEEHLPWELPTDVDFNPKGESPLATSKEFIERTEKLYGKGWRPEFDTMDTFVDSSWYFLRFPQKTYSEHSESQNIRSSGKSDHQTIRQPESSEFSKQLPFDPDLLKRWLPVDFYMIGPEHIVLHLLYSRFFTKFFRDQGLLEFDEPFSRMRHQGMILGPDHKKMSKSKGNVIDPDGVIDQYGADTLRMYEMFMGPIEADKPWNDRSVVGVRRFLERAYNLVNKSQILNTKSQTNSKSQITNSKLKIKLHQTVKKVSEDIPDLKFNTAIAAMMEFVNEWEAESKLQATSYPPSHQASDGQSKLQAEEIGMFVRILAPFAPFLAEELWQMIQKQPQVDTKKDFDSVHLEEWPEWDESLTVSQDFLYVVQVNGKLRDSFHTPKANTEKDDIIQTARGMSKVSKWILGKPERKIIFVPATKDKQGMINFVVG